MPRQIDLYSAARMPILRRAMFSGSSAGRPPRVIVSAIALLILLPAAAHAQLPAIAKDGGPLSPALEKLAEPAVRSLSPAKQARAIGVAPSGPGSLIRPGSRVLVYVRHAPGAGDLPALRARGARLVADSRPYRTVTAAVSPADLRVLSRTPGVTSVTPVRAPVLRAACDGGSVISEGVAQLNVLPARKAPFEVEGQAITVGVLSDSFDQATEAVTGGEIATKAEKDEETGDLPGPKSPCGTQQNNVDELEPFLFPEFAEPLDEGRAMLQIVHDIAPEADLAFHSAFNGELDFAEGIEDLAAAGADAIVDDVGYFEEPFFQDGPVAAAVNKVAEEGASYLSSAGNDNLFDAEGNEIASWEAPAFRDSGACPPQVAALPGFNAVHCMDFDPGEARTDRTFGIRVEPGKILSVDLQWAEPWQAVATDLDAILLDSEGSVLTGSADDNASSEVEGGTQRPIEIVQWENDSADEKTVQLAINKFSGPADPRLKFIFLQNGGGVSGTEYPRSGGGDVVGPSIYGHAGAAGAIAVGAVRFDDSSEPEPYSSRGPVTHYFGPVEGTGPAAALPVPEALSKPEVAATDCGKTTFFAFKSAGVWRFCGTSAAAPHAAGVAALMLEDETGVSPAAVRNALANSGDPFIGFGPCSQGGGLIEAVGALEAIEGTSFPAAGTCEPPDASGAVFVAPGDWGSESPPEPTAPPTQPAAVLPPPVPSPSQVKAGAPSTFFARHPRRVVGARGRGARVVFRFGSDQAGVTFLCKVDRSRFHRCPRRFVRRYGRGNHVLRVKARSAAGLVDRTPAVFRFRVRRR
jgi:Subtilase family